MESPFHTEDVGASLSCVDLGMCELCCYNLTHVSLITVGLHANVVRITHLLLPSTVAQKQFITQASYYRITKLRAHIT